MFHRVRMNSYMLRGKQITITIEWVDFQLIYSAMQWNLDLLRAKGMTKCVRYNKVLFHIFYHYWCKANRSLYQGLPYIGVHYIEVPL